MPCSTRKQYGAQALQWSQQQVATDLSQCVMLYMQGKSRCVAPASGLYGKGSAWLPDLTHLVELISAPVQEQQRLWEEQQLQQQQAEQELLQLQHKWQQAMQQQTQQANQHQQADPHQHRSCHWKGCAAAEGPAAGSACANSGCSTASVKAAAVPSWCQLPKQQLSVVLHGLENSTTNAGVDPSCRGPALGEGMQKRSPNPSPASLSGSAGDNQANHASAPASNPDDRSLTTILAQLQELNRKAAAGGTLDSIHESSAHSLTRASLGFGLAVAGAGMAASSLTACSSRSPMAALQQSKQLVHRPDTEDTRAALNPAGEDSPHERSGIFGSRGKSSWQRQEPPMLQSLAAGPSGSVSAHTPLLRDSVACKYNMYHNNTLFSDSGSGGWGAEV